MTSNADCPLNPEQLAVAEKIAQDLVRAVADGGPLAGYGFAIYFIPPDRGVSALLATVPREKVAEAVGGWMLANHFAVGVPISTPGKPN